MKKLLAPLALAATATLAAAPAHAFTPGGPFTLTGPVTIKVGAVTVPCTATLQAVGVPGGGGNIVSAALTGSTFCVSLRPVGFPWVMTPSGPTALTISNVAIATTGITCGPATVAATWSNTPPGTMSISGALLPPTCQIVTATLSASPPQTLP